MKKRGALLDVQRANKFHDFIFECELMAINIIEGEFTWDNNKDDEGFIHEKLNWILCNLKWQDLFQDYNGKIELPIGSNYKSIILNLKMSGNKFPRSYKFDSNGLLQANVVISLRMNRGL